MRKRIASAFLAFVMLVSLLPSVAYATENEDAVVVNDVHSSDDKEEDKDQRDEIESDEDKDQKDKIESDEDKDQKDKQDAVDEKQTENGGGNRNPRRSRKNCRNRSI